MNIWWQLILIRSQIIMKLFMRSKLMKYYFKKIDTSFHQRLPNMVQRLFADVIHDGIWFMNIHEQNHPWFMAMTCLCFISDRLIIDFVVVGVSIYHFREFDWRNRGRSDCFNNRNSSLYSCHEKTFSCNGITKQWYDIYNPATSKQCLCGNIQYRTASTVQSTESR